MPRLLLPIDGSEGSMQAVDHVLRTRDWYKDGVELHLLNVQRPLPGDVSMFIPADQIKRFHQQEGLKALAAARSKLDVAKLAYVYHVRTGEPSEEIADYAKAQHCDQIGMGVRGLGAVAGILLGSVSIKVIHLSSVPVLLVK